MTAFRVIVLDDPHSDVLLSALRETEPDVVVLDTDRLRSTSLPTPARLHQAAPKAEWVLSLWGTSSSAVELLLDLGARAAVDHDAPASLWERAIRAVLGGEIWLPRGTERWLYLKAQASRRRDPEPDRSAAFTDREAEIHGLLERGLTNKEIARRLFISPNTVKKHVAAVFQKVGLRSRRQVFCGDAGPERALVTDKTSDSSPFRA